jgi:flagellar biosynthesis/type III secretory pathway chaperone
MDEIRNVKVTEVTNRLLQNLDDMVTAYRQLLESVRLERDFLAESKIDKIQQNNEIKEGLLTRIKALDSIRERYAKELAHLVNLESDYPRLLELAKKVPFELGEKLRLSHATLDLIVRRLSTLNQQNQKVVEASLATLHGALNELKDALNPSKTYGRDKKVGHINEGSGVLRNQKA